jgi:hypothetical protein
MLILDKIGLFFTSISQYSRGSENGVKSNVCLVYPILMVYLTYGHWPFYTKNKYYLIILKHHLNGLGLYK